MVSYVNSEEKMKKIISICALLLASLLIFTACDESTPCDVHTDENSDGICDVCREEVSLDCTSHTDADSDGKCDACGDEVSAPAIMIDYTIVVTDQDGEKIEGAELTIYAGFDKAASATTDSDGKISVKLAEGQYTVSFDLLPDGYFPYEASTLILVSLETNSTEILVENTIPDGSKERPFPVSFENPSISLPANASFYFSLGGGRRIMKLSATDIELVYNDNTYTPDSNGNIEIKFTPESQFSPTIIKFTNKSNSEKIIDLTFESILGSPERPFEAKIETTYSTRIEKENTLYYQLIADKAGFICVTSYTPHGTIMLYNKTTMEVSAYTQGKVCEYIWVNTGDELSVAIASTSKDDISSVDFLLTYAKGDADMPIILLDNTVNFSIPAGKEYSFVSLLLGADTFKIKDKNVTVKINGTELTADENGNIEYRFAPGDLITILNLTEERHEVTIRLTASTEQ